MTTAQDREQTENTTNNEHNESTPLKPQKRTPLPKLQLFIVFLVQFAEPVTATVIYPFVNQFVRSTGITGGDERRTGYYAGVIESIFFIAEALTVLHWGRLSDYVGRKPVLLLGPLGLGFSMMMFGLSTTFWMLVVSRCLQGIFNGNIGVSKTVLVEISDHTNLADAYAIIPLMWSFGSTLGPIIGGILASPGERWPDTFGKIPFFLDHPYFLPCAVAALIAFTSAGTSIIALKETLPSRKMGKAGSQPSSGSPTPLINDQTESPYGSTTTADLENILEEQSAEAPPPFKDLLVPQILKPLSIYGFLSFIDMCTAVLMPLVFSTSTSLGGVGFDAYRIGIIMGTWGILNAIIQASFLGTAIRAIGPHRMIVVSFSSYFMVLSLYPVLSYFAQRAGYADTRVWAIIIIQLICMISNNAAYAASQIIIVDNTPSRAALGSTNGMAQAVASGMRSIAPSFASSLFSVSLEQRLAGGNMVYYILMAVTLVGIKGALSLAKPLKSQRK